MLRRKAKRGGDNDGGDIIGDKRALLMAVDPVRSEEHKATVVEVNDDGQTRHRVVVGRELGGSKDSDPCFLFGVDGYIF